MTPAQYFPHDYHARHHPQLLALRRRHGLAGLGAFWCLVEYLYEQGGRVPLDQLPELAYDLHAEAELLTSVVHDFGLFEVDAAGLLRSPAVDERLAIRAEKSGRAQEKAKKRWGEDERRVRAQDTLFYVIRIYNEEEEFIKAGITSESVSRRYSGKLKPYNYELLFSHDFPSRFALNIEDEIAAKCQRHEPRNKFAGILECYKIEEKTKILEIANAAKEIRNANKEKEKEKVKEKRKINNKQPLSTTYAAEAAPESEADLPTTEKKEGTRAPADFQPTGLDLVLLQRDDVAEAWQAFLAHRRKIKAPVTPYALDLILKKLRQLRGTDGAGWAELLNAAVERGWRSVFEIDPQLKNRTHDHRTPTPKPTLAQRYNDAARDLLAGL